MIALKFIPIPAGIVVVQNVLISAIISYIVCEIIQGIEEYKRKIRYYVILMLPFFLLPIIAHNLYTLRLVPYTYIMVLALFLTIKYYKQNGRITELQTVKLAILFFLLSTWRTEGIYNILVYIIINFVFVKKGLQEKKDSIVYTILLIIMIITTKQINTKYNGENGKYNIVATIEQMTKLVIKAEEENDKESLEKVDKVLNVDLILKNKEKSGIRLYWEQESNVRKDWSKEEYNEYMKTYFKLILKYPTIFIKERTNEYIRSNGLVPNTKNNTYDPNYDMTLKYVMLLQHNTTLKGKSLINLEKREKVVRILEAKTIEDYEKTNNITNPIFYNTIPSTIIIIGTVIVLIRKREKFEAIIIGSVLIKTILVFLTAPDSFFMYYLPEYLIGYILLVYSVVKICIKKEEKNK